MSEHQANTKEGADRRPTITKITQDQREKLSKIVKREIGEEETILVATIAVFKLADGRYECAVSTDTNKGLFDQMGGEMATQCLMQASAAAVRKQVERKSRIIRPATIAPKGFKIQ